MNGDNRMTNSIFDQAMKYRAVAKEMHAFIGKLNCECVETPEYVEFQEQRSKRASKMSREERLLFVIFEDFKGEKLLHECERCRVMFAYETLIGDDAVVLECIERRRKK